MPYLETAHHHLFYTFNRISPADGRLPALVLVHGAGGSHLDWPPALRLWSHGPVYALDLPGHGRSAPPGADNIPAYAAALQSFLAGLGLERLVLMGHSMGGAVVQQLALTPPSAVAALVLLGTGARLRVNPRFIAGLALSFPETIREINNYLWSEHIPPAVRDETAQRMAGLPMTVVRDDFVACNQFDLRPRLHEITLPSLVITGTADRMTPLKYGQTLAEHLPHGRLITIPAAGHMTAQEQPTQVAAAVQDFLGDLN